MAKRPKTPKTWTPETKSRATGLGLLREPSFYLHLLWGASLGIPFWVGSEIFTGTGWWVVLPLGVALALVIASGLNLPFPRLPAQIPRAVVGSLLFSVTFLQKVNTTQADYRPYWVNLTLWVSLVLLVFSFQLRDFTVTVAALVSGLISFITLLI